MWVWELKYHNSQKKTHFEESTVPMDVLWKIMVATGYNYIYIHVPYVHMYYQIAACNLVPLLPATTHTIAISMV